MVDVLCICISGQCMEDSREFNEQQQWPFKGDLNCNNFSDKMSLISVAAA